jgi:hypothetical protein
MSNDNTEYADENDPLQQSLFNHSVKRNYALYLISCKLINDLKDIKNYIDKFKPQDEETKIYFRIKLINIIMVIEI